MLPTEEIWMNKETGELQGATQIIKDFYKTHSGLEDWREGWVFTGEYDDTFLLPPQFWAAVNI